MYDTEEVGDFYDEHERLPDPDEVDVGRKEITYWVHEQVQEFYDDVIVAVPFDDAINTITEERGEGHKWMESVGYEEYRSVEKPDYSDEAVMVSYEWNPS